MSTHIRWMIRRDFADVQRIEDASFTQPWTEKELLACLRQRNAVGMAAEVDEQVVAYMVYAVHAKELELLNLAVAPEFRRAGIGRQMIEKLRSKLSYHRRREIVATVRETNLAAQLFFRSQGFLAESVARGHYEDTGEDGYVMAYELFENARSNRRNAEARQ